MNLAHLHLILNHVPTVGTAIAFGLLVLSLIRKNDGLRRVGLEVFCVIALLTLPTYLSGVGTQAEIDKMPSVSVDSIQKHHDAAFLASVFMLLTGATAWLGLWQVRRVTRQSSLNLSAVLLFSVVTLALMARTATIGGEIRHGEILTDQATAATEGTVSFQPTWLTARWVAALVTDHTWVWPASEALHFIGLWLLFGVVLLVNLRMLGMMKSVSFAALHRLLPWAGLGLCVNAITGMGFVIATPEQYMQNVAFFWKMTLLLLAGFNLLYLTAFEGPWEVGPGDNAPPRVKAMAASAIALWVGVMYFGRMLPFLGNAF
jgi:uncharacterized membrane protein